MQVRAAILPNRSVAARPLTSPAPQAAAAAPGQAPAPKQAIKPRNADAGFGSEIFQSILYGVTNLGQIIALPGGISNLIQALPASMLGVMNLVLGGMNGFKDWKGLSKVGNTRSSDDYTRLAGDGAIVAGGLLLLGGAFIAPVVPLIGAGLAAAGYLARAVGVWNDESRW